MNGRKRQLAQPLVPHTTADISRFETLCGRGGESLEWQDPRAVGLSVGMTICDSIAEQRQIMQRIHEEPDYTPPGEAPLTLPMHVEAGIPLVLRIYP